MYILEQQNPLFVIKNKPVHQPERLQFHAVSDQDSEWIEQCAQWYWEEWNIPISRTRQQLQRFPNEAVLNVWGATLDGIPLGVASLYRQVGLHNRIGKYQDLGPWLALFYIRSSLRGKGWGSRFIQFVEAESARNGHAELFLYTDTAESLYRREGWTEYERATVGGRDLIVMRKKLVPVPPY